MGNGGPTRPGHTFHGAVEASVRTVPPSPGRPLFHDYTTKMKHVQRFLGEGNKVKLTIMFRGREMAHPELGLKILNKIAEDVAEMAIVESSPRQDGRNMTMVLHPTKKPKPAKKSDGGDNRPNGSAPTEGA
jgi:translation initiation factor IF-3